MVQLISRTVVDLNQKTFERLKAALNLNLRRQVFVAICDDLTLRDRLAVQLERELSGYSFSSAQAQNQSQSQRRRHAYPQLVTLALDLRQPDPIAQVSQWLQEYPPQRNRQGLLLMPAFQMVGIEKLSRQPAAAQWLFLNHLRGLERSLPALESSLLLWVTRPWSRMIPQSAPNFWRCRTAVFDFIGEPTPFVSEPETFPVSRRSPSLTPVPAMKAASEIRTVAAQTVPQPQTQPLAQPLQSKEPPKAKPTPSVSRPAEPEREDPQPAAQGSSSAHSPVHSQAQPQANPPAKPPAQPQSDPAAATGATHEADAQALLEKWLQSSRKKQPDLASQTGQDSGLKIGMEPGAIAPHSHALPSGADTSRPTSSSEPANNPETVEPPALPPASSSQGTAEELTPTQEAIAPGSAPASGQRPRIHQLQVNMDELLDDAPSTAESDAESHTHAADPAPTAPTAPAVDAPLTHITPLLDDGDDAGETSIDVPAAQALSDPWLAGQLQDDIAALDQTAQDNETDPLLTNAELTDAELNDPEPLLILDDASAPTVPVPLEEPFIETENEPEHKAEGEPLEVMDAEPNFLRTSLPQTPSSNGQAGLGVGGPVSDWLEAGLAEAFQDDLERTDPEAYAILQQIEHLRQQQAPVRVIAGTYRGLGNLYRDRIEQGDISPKNLLRAMKAYEQVLHFVREDSPIWSEVLNDMGNLCWLLSRCAPAPEQGLPHLQQGINAYQMALQKINPQTHPQTYPMIQNNLGAAYGDLARYQSPIENLRKSIQAYQEALRFRKADLDPLRYASTQNNLGTTYWNLAQYRDAKSNLKQAIAAYREALNYYQPNKDPLNFAMIQNNLGTAYWNLAQHERSEQWLQLAIESYTHALTYRTMESNPAAFAATQNNLGTAYWHLSGHYEHQPDQQYEFLAKAVDAYDAALQAIAIGQAGDRPLALNFDVLATRNNLGLVQYQVATDAKMSGRLTSEMDYLGTALDHHLTALQGWQGRPDLRQTAMKCVIQTLKAIYTQKGLVGQNLALSKIPGQLLPEILPQL